MVAAFHEAGPHGYAQCMITGGTAFSKAMGPRSKLPYIESPTMT
jgi:hypothetical protein